MKISNTDIDRLLERITKDWRLVKVDDDYFITHSNKNDEKHVVCFAPLSGKKDRIYNDLNFIASAPSIVTQLNNEHREMNRFISDLYEMILSMPTS